MGKDVNGNEKNKLLGDARQRRRKEDVSVKQQNHLIQVLKRKKNTKKVADEKILVTLTVPHIVLKNLPVAEPKGVKVGTSPNAAGTSLNVAETSLKNEWFAVPLLLRNVVIRFLLKDDVIPVNLIHQIRRKGKKRKNQEKIQAMKILLNPRTATKKQKRGNGRCQLKTAVLMAKRTVTMIAKSREKRGKRPRRTKRPKKLKSLRRPKNRRKERIPQVKQRRIWRQNFEN